MAWHLQDKQFVNPSDVATELTQQGVLNVSYLAYNSESCVPAFELQQPLQLTKSEVEAWLATMSPGDVWITPAGVVTLH